MLKRLQITKKTLPGLKRNGATFCCGLMKDGLFFHGGASIMTWGCFSHYGVGSIDHIPGIVDQFEYIKILKELMLFYAEVEMPLKWVFQQDNKPKHTGKQGHFGSRQTRSTSWPAQSSDGEKLWNGIKQS